VLFVLLALSPLALGCSGNKSNDPEALRWQTELGQFHEVYTMFSKRNQRPPKQPSELIKDYDAIYPEALRSVQNGQVTVLWGTAAGRGSTAVLAHEKDAPQQGGYVVLGDGTVKKMTAQELQAAIKH
jgi:hypothetical protein